MHRISNFQDDAENLLVNGVNIFGLTFPTKSYQLEFDRTLSGIRDHSYWIDVEAFVAFHEASMDISTKRHEEIMSNLASPLGSPPVSTSPAIMPRAEIVKRHYQMIPWPENPQFYGRIDELKLLYNTLPTSICDRLLIFSIIGMGGVGKSQLALRYLYENVSQLEAVFWVAADSKAKVAQGYAGIAKEVGLLDGVSQPPALEMIRDWVKQWFKNTSECNLKKRLEFR